MPHIRRVLPTAVLASLLVGKAGAEQPRQPQVPGPEATLKRGNESVVSARVREHAVGMEGQIVSEARSVSYRPQPAELFQVPPGDTPLLAPEGGPVP